MSVVVRRGLATLGVLVVASLALATAPPVAADHVPVHFGEPSASATWGEGIEFVQPVETSGRIERLEVLIGRPGDPGPFVVEVPPPSGGGSITLRQVIDTETSGHLLPNTTLSARWVATLAGEAREVVTGPEVRVTYRDTDHEWHTREGEIVRVHWYDGGDAFGERALAIGEAAVAETSALLGVTETEPIDFFVYASEEDFREVLGPGTRENVGGQANAEIRTLFGLIAPTEINDPWVESVIPHELTHLVFDTAVRNPYHFPPRWLNEGLAVYLSEGYRSSDRRLVEGAVADGALIPLDGLTGQFPTTREGFFLAYAESVAAVDFFVRTHGRDALIGLVRSYADGLTDDEAFRRAIGQTVAEFDARWREELSAGDPSVHGPQSPRAGPLPPGWDVTPAGPVGTTAPAATTAPGGSARSGPGGGTDEPVAAGSAAGSGAGSDGRLAVAAIVAVVSVLLLVFGVVSHARAGRTSAAPPFQHASYSGTAPPPPPPPPGAWRRRGDRPPGWS